MNRRLDNDRTIRSPHGSEISAKSWLTEAPLADADEQSRS